jgi:hypothetical protein
MRNLEAKVPEDVWPSSRHVYKRPRSSVLAERSRSVKVTEFGRQMTALLKELDHEYEATVGLNAEPSKDEAQVRISGRSRT